MDRIGLEFFGLDNRRRRGGSRKKRHMRLAANAVTGHDADPCYHHIIVRFHRLSSFAAGPAETVTAIHSGCEQPLHALRNKARDADWQW
jgi:hypothetical protein